VGSVLLILGVFGAVYLFASLINTSDFRDPRKKDIVNIKSIESDKLIQYPYLTILIR